MEVNLLEEREDGYQAYCIIFSPAEVKELDELAHGDSIEYIIECVIKDGLGG